MNLPAAKRSWLGTGETGGLNRGASWRVHTCQSQIRQTCIGFSRLNRLKIISKSWKLWIGRVNNWSSGRNEYFRPVGFQSASGPKLLWTVKSNEANIREIPKINSNEFIWRVIRAAMTFECRPCSARRWLLRSALMAYFSLTECRWITRKSSIKGLTDRWMLSIRMRCLMWSVRGSATIIDRVESARTHWWYWICVFIDRWLESVWIVRWFGSLIRIVCECCVLCVRWFEINIRVMIRRREKDQID